MLTPHIKRKKCKKKNPTPSRTARDPRCRREEETSRWSKKEKRKKRKEGRRKDLAGRGSARPSAGSRRKDLRWVSPGLFVFFFFFFFPSNDLESPLGLLPEGSRRRSEPRQLAATHLVASRGPATDDRTAAALFPFSMTLHQLKLQSQIKSSSSNGQMSLPTKDISFSFI
jgi:hypothetical protein